MSTLIPRLSFPWPLTTCFLRPRLNRALDLALTATTCPDPTPGVKDLPGSNNLAGLNPIDGSSEKSLVTATQ